VVSDEHELLRGFREARENMRLQHLPGLLHHHHLGRHTLENVLIQGRSSRGRPDDLHPFESALPVQLPPRAELIEEALEIVDVVDDLRGNGGEQGR
jgi:hypothetical protein